MKIDDLAADLDKKGVRSVYALAGSEPYFRDAGWRLIRSQVLAQDPSAECRTVDPDGDRSGAPRFDFARFLSDLATPTLFSGHSCIRLRSADALLKEKRDRLASFIEAPPAVVTLVLDLEGLDRRTKFAKRLESLGAVVECPALFSSPPPWSHDAPHENDLARWVARQAAARGKKMRLEDANLLAERVGNNLFALASEIEKLASYVGRASAVTADDVRSLVGASRKLKFYELTESVLAGRAAEALGRARTLFDEGIEDGSGRLVQSPEAIALMALGALASEFRRVRAAREWLADTRGAGGERALAEALSVRPFVAGRLLSTARRLTGPQIASMVRALDACDRDLKTGRGPADWILTRTLWTLTQPSPRGRTPVPTS